MEVFSEEVIVEDLALKAQIDGTKYLYVILFPENFELGSSADLLIDSTAPFVLGFNRGPRQNAAGALKNKVTVCFVCEMASRSAELHSSYHPQHNTAKLFPSFQFKID